jgi:hypothetical protein
MRNFDLELAANPTLREEVSLRLSRCSKVMVSQLSGWSFRHGQMAFRCKYLRLALPTLLLPFLLLTPHAGTSGSSPGLDGRDDPPWALYEPPCRDIVGLNCRNYEETVACACGGMAGCTRVGVVVDGTTPVRYVIGYLPQRIGASWNLVSNKRGLRERCFASAVAHSSLKRST